MRTLTAILVTALLTLIMSTSHSAEVIAGEAGVDGFGSKTITVTQEQVDDVWLNFNLPGGLKDQLNQRGIEVYGLEAKYVDGQYIAKTQVTGMYQNEYSENWTSIEYACDENSESHWSIAFWRDPDTGVITFYYPGEAKF